MYFNKSAIPRAGVASARFFIEDVSLYMFGTGIGIILMEIRIDAPDADNNTLSFKLMIEVLYALSQGGPKVSSLGFEGQEQQKQLTMETIAKSLLGPLDFPNWHRVFTYCTVKIVNSSETAGDSRFAAYRLARKYTSLYFHSDDWAKYVHTPFGNILHCVCLEGGVAIAEERIIEGKVPDFIQQFVSDTSKKVYIPIALLAYQEYLKLIKMSQESPTPIDFKRVTKVDREALENLQENLLDFRLNYRFSHISRITMHNQVFDLWRDGFSLNDILEEVSQDIKEAASFLKYTYDQKLQAVNRHQTALGIFLGMLVIFVSLLSTNLFEYQNIWFASPSVLASAVFFGGIGVLGAWWYLRHSKED